MESTNIFIFDSLDPLFFSNSVQKERGTCSWQTLSNGNGILEQFPARKKPETVVHLCRNFLLHGQFSCFYFSDWNKLKVNRKCIKKFKVFLIRSLCKDIKFSYYWVFYTIFGGMVSCFFTMLKEKKKYNIRNKDKEFSISILYREPQSLIKRGIFKRTLIND